MVIYCTNFGRNLSAPRNRFKNLILNAHQQQRIRGLSETEINAERHRLISIEKYLPVFTEEIRSMMFTFGNCQEPLTEAVFLVEKILRDQMNKLLVKATEATHIRGGSHISHEDVLFVIRKNRVVVRRLMQYLQIMDTKALIYRQNKMDLDAVPPNLLPRGLRVKVCLAFLDHLDESGSLGSVLDEFVDDPVGTERTLRRNKMTLQMSTEEYIEFSKRLGASFIPRGRIKKFQDWLLEDKATSMLLTKLAVEMINFLARETVANIVDLALQIKKQTPSVSCVPASNINKNIEESFEDTDNEDFQDIDGAESANTPVTGNIYLRSEAPRSIKYEDSGIIDLAHDKSKASAESMMECECQEDDKNEYDKNSDNETSSEEEKPKKASSDESSDELSDNHATDDDEMESEGYTSDNEDTSEDEDMSDAENISDNDEDSASSDGDIADTKNVSDNDEENASSDEDIAGAGNVPGNDKDNASSDEDIADVENVPDNDENNASNDEDIAGAGNVPDNDKDNASSDEDIADVENVPDNDGDNVSSDEDIAGAGNVPDNDKDIAFNDEHIAGSEIVPDNDEDNAFNGEDIADAENVPGNDEDNACSDEDIAGAKNVPHNDEDSASNDEDIDHAKDVSGDENTSNDETASSTENSENSSCDEKGESEEEESVEENEESSDENECESSSDEKSGDVIENSVNESDEDSTENSDSPQNNSEENSPEAKTSYEDFVNKEEPSCLLEKENISGNEKLPEAENYHKTSVVPESDEVCQKEDTRHLAKTDYIFSLNEHGMSDISGAECSDASQKLDIQDKQSCDTLIENSNIQKEIPIGTTLHEPSDLNIAVTYEKPSTEVDSKSHFVTKVSDIRVSATEELLIETVEESQTCGDGEAQSVLVKPIDVDAMDEEEIQPNNSVNIPSAPAATETCEEMDASQSDINTQASSSALEPAKEDIDSDPVPSPQTYYRQIFKPYPFRPSKFPTPVFSRDPELEDIHSIEDKLSQGEQKLEPYETEPITPYDIEEGLRLFHMPNQPSLFFKMTAHWIEVTSERLLFC